jgi:hypothetical protein
VKAYRIQNDIVAAANEQEAIAAWSEQTNMPAASAGPLEEINPAELSIEIENEFGAFRTGKLSEVMPDAGPAQVVAFGECEDCG